jgi:periplasmic protein TonB
MNLRLTPRRLLLAAALFTTLWLAGCGTSPHSPSGGSVPGQLSNATSTPGNGSRPVPRPSHATSAREYRRDAARHVYELNKERIYEGKLPPMLYAVGTLQVNLDASGRVVSMHWMRAPLHAPEVIAEIERTVLADAPYPAAQQLGGVTWTDTWLWDEGGHFQLDTLSEGQLESALQSQEPR